MEFGGLSDDGSDSDRSVNPPASTERAMGLFNESEFGDALDVERLAISQPRTMLSASDLAKYRSWTPEELISTFLIKA